MHIRGYVCLCTSEMNDSNDTRDEREGIVLFCHRHTVKHTGLFASV